ASTTAVDSRLVPSARRQVPAHASRHWAVPDSTPEHHVPSDSPVAPKRYQFSPNSISSRVEVLSRLSAVPVAPDSGQLPCHEVSRPSAMPSSIRGLFHEYAHCASRTPALKVMSSRSRITPVVPSE
ncbi:Unknown protein, partial [Striga hermonthica]